MSLIAASAGLTVAKPQPDVDGIDLFLNYPKARGTRYRPQIDVQVKTVRKPEYADNKELTYSLAAKHFNELAGTGFDTPRYLIVIHVPQDPCDYIHAEEEDTELRVRHRGYWVSLEDHTPIVGTGQKSKTVRLPRANHVTPAALLRLMIRPEAS
ncbi:DUF4365 domain-containing protein [Streptosporangium sp. NBC_01469]|uniref:DUF4365 domain-containing protein n=1 Tax=Streptosporangium sp. NBC_01469 TaxID=2903898 RepID=UPI002E2E6F5A|nr:DUF4365 domain-containing protein [Streptosporangium sp. NBC_01469]